MKNYLFTLFISFWFCPIITAQQLSATEFLSLKDLPVSTIDSLLRARKFLRSDTAAGNLQFRFYGYSKMNGKIAELHYVQLAIKPDDTYAEIQYQTSDETEVEKFQQQLIDEGFKKMKSIDETEVFLFLKDEIVIHHSSEIIPNLKTILYTFSMHEDVNHNVPLMQLVL